MSKTEKMITIVIVLAASQKRQRVYRSGSQIRTSCCGSSYAAELNCSFRHDNYMLAGLVLISKPRPILKALVQLFRHKYQNRKLKDFIILKSISILILKFEILKCSANMMQMQ